MLLLLVSIGWLLAKLLLLLVMLLLLLLWLLQSTVKDRIAVLIPTAGRLGGGRREEGSGSKGVRPRLAAHHGHRPFRLRGRYSGNSLTKQKSH